MTRVFVGSEVLATGQVNRYQLSQKFQRVFPDVYAPPGPLSLQDRTVAAWLWSGRQAIVTGRAAAALHGSRWVDPDVPIELNFGNNRSPRGIVIRVLADHRPTEVINRVHRAWDVRRGRIAG